MHPAALICPNDTRGKDPWSFSPRGSPFSFTTRPAKKTQRNTQRTQSPQDAKNARNAIRNDKRRKNTQRTPKARTLSKILLLSPKWVPPVDRMIFISPTCILTGREALAGREGRAGWVDRKKDAKICMFRKYTKQNAATLIN